MTFEEYKVASEKDKEIYRLESKMCALSCKGEEIDQADIDRLRELKGMEGEPQPEPQPQPTERTLVLDAPFNDGTGKDLTSNHVVRGDIRTGVNIGLKHGVIDPEIPLNGKSFRIEANVKFDHVDERNLWFAVGKGHDKNASFHMGSLDKDTLRVSFYGNDIDVKSQRDPGKWHKIAFEFDAKTKNGFVEYDDKEIGAKNFGTVYKGVLSAFCAWVADNSKETKATIMDAKVWTW